MANSSGPLVGVAVCDILAGLEAMGLKQRRYRALVGLSYPADPRTVQRLLAGEQIPMDQRDLVEIAAGDIAEGLPSVSVPGLLAKGRIEEVK